MSPISCTAVTPTTNLAWAVGDELRRARQDLAWPPQELVQRVPGINDRTLYRTECGYRLCSLDTLVNLCWAMAMAPADLLELAMQRMHLHIDRLTLHVDLPAVAADTRFTRLWSLRRWAARRLAGGLHRHGVVRIPPDAVATLAAALSIKTYDIAGYLARKPPQTIRGSTSCTTRTDPTEQPPSLTKAQLAGALGRELRRVRTDNHWSIEDVARRLTSISAHTLSQHEDGRTLSSLAQLIDLGEALDISAPRLLHGALSSFPEPLVEADRIASPPSDTVLNSGATHPDGPPKLGARPCRPRGTAHDRLAADGTP